MIVPCKNCSDRFASCHSSCEKYKSWKEEMDVIRNRVLEEKLKNRRADDFRTDSITKMIKKHKHT